MTTRDEFIEQAKATLDRCNAEIDEWDTKARHLAADAKGRYQSRMDELVSRRDAARAKLHELRHASVDAWHDLKVGVEAAFEALKNALEKMRAHFV